MADRYHPMMFAVWILLALLVGSVIWRVTCRFVTVPWPYWLAWWLENPYMRLFANPHQLVDRLQLAPGMRVLDVGCGAGRLAIPIAQAVGPQGQVTAIDPQAGMIQLIIRQRDRQGLDHLAIHHADLQTMPEPAAPYDRIVMVTVLGEIPDREATLGRLHDLLTRNGQLAIMEVLPDPCYQTQGVVTRLATAHGFSLTSTHTNKLAYTAIFSKQI